MSVVLPALNEEDGIVAAVADAVAAMSELVDRRSIADFEVLVVDDGSTDETANLVETCIAREPRVRLLRHSRNRGVGAGLRTAIEAAGGHYLVYTDADMPIDLRVVGPALDLLADPEVGIVAGQRIEYGADGRFRSLASRLYDRAARWWFGVAIPDVNFPLKVLGTDTARRIDLRSEGALIDVELLAGIARTGMRIERLSVEYRTRRFGRSKTMTASLISQLVVESFRWRRSIRRRG